MERLRARQGEVTEHDEPAEVVDLFPAGLAEALQAYGWPHAPAVDGGGSVARHPAAAAWRPSLLERALVDGDCGVWGPPAVDHARIRANLELCGLHLPPESFTWPPRPAPPRLPWEAIVERVERTRA